MPQPVGATELTVLTSRGFPTSAGTLAGLFGTFNGGGDAAIDPIASAQTTPGTFMPQCGLTASIVLRGGGCNTGLGWYNATEPATTPAAVYPIIPTDLKAAPPNGISCLDSDFCPLASRTTTQAPQHSWADPLPAFAAGIRDNPSWSGGKVGFATIGRTGSICTQTKYSQADLSDKSPSGAPWVTALVYKSVADPNGYYLAFEDMPTCASSWKGCGGLYMNDGDFNDLVVYITDVPCTGGTAGTGGSTVRAERAAPAGRPAPGERPAPREPSARPGRRARAARRVPQARQALRARQVPRARRALRARQAPRARRALRARTALRARRALRARQVPRGRRALRARTAWAVILTGPKRAPATATAPVTRGSPASQTCV